MATSAKFAPGGRRPAAPGLIAGLLLAVLTLTGCVTVQLKATVHPDGTLSGTTRIGVAKAIASMTGGAAAVRQQLIGASPCDFGSHQGRVSDFDDGTYVGIDCSFDHVTTAEFDSGEQGPKLARVGADFRLSGTLDVGQVIASSGSLLGSLGAPGAAVPSGLPSDLSGLLPSGLPSDLSGLLPSGLPSDLSGLLPSGLPSNLSGLLPSGAPSGLPTGPLDPSTLLSTAKISFAFTFPGKVKSSAGKVHGRTVTFTPDGRGAIDFTTTAAATGTGGDGTGRRLLAGVVILALLAGGGLLLARDRRNARPAAYPGPPYGAGQHGTGTHGAGPYGTHPPQPPAEPWASQGPSPWAPPPGSTGPWGPRPGPDEHEQG